MLTGLSSSLRLLDRPLLGPLLVEDGGFHALTSSPSLFLLSVKDCSSLTWWHNAVKRIFPSTLHVFLTLPSFAVSIYLELELLFIERPKALSFHTLALFSKITRARLSSLREKKSESLNFQCLTLHVMTPIVCMRHSAAKAWNASISSIWILANFLGSGLNA